MASPDHEGLHQQWANVLNPQTLRANLIKASVFVTAYEMLKQSVVDHPLCFFATEFTEAGEPVRNAAYDTEVLSLDPKGKQAPLRSSVEWLIKIGAWNVSDRETFSHVTDCRNGYAHQIGTYLTNPRQDDELMFTNILNLYRSLKLWWVVNIELAVDPDFVSGEVNPEDIVPMGEWWIQMLREVGRGDNERLEAVYQEWLKVQGMNPNA